MPDIVPSSGRMVTSTELRGFGKLRELLKARMDKMANDTISSPCADYSAYQQRVGKYQGLKDALAMLDTVEKETNV